MYPSYYYVMWGVVGHSALLLGMAMAEHEGKQWVVVGGLSLFMMGDIVGKREILVRC